MRGIKLIIFFILAFLNFYSSLFAGIIAEGWKDARERGLVRSEGRDYVMQDGDVVEFKIGT